MDFLLIGDIAIEAFTCLIIFKNIFAFALTFKGYDWLVERGTWDIFLAVSSVQVGVCVLSIFMCKSFLDVHCFSDFYDTLYTN